MPPWRGFTTLSQDNHKDILAQDILSDLNATIGLDRLSSEAIAELNSSGLEDNSVTMAKLEPQP